eukprot:GHVR01112815.1.p3 GENE.GHVR01112815.1~~GHVR01112815.1.p3  ORF type:complete len:192 (+),score=37.32 GHVR01112815.1:698-1273(+)
MKKTRKPDRLTNPSDDPIADGQIYESLRPVDKVAVEMEAKWGVGRLTSLVSVDTARKFGAASQKLNVAIDDRDPDEVAKRASVMVRAWNALDVEATNAGMVPVNDEVEVWVAMDDEGTSFSVVRTLAEATMLAKQKVSGRVYHLEEIARIIAMFERQAPIVQNAKDTFPGAVVTDIRSTKDESLGQDPIPF